MVGLHHYHKRKRIHQNLERYPHPDKWKRFLDRIIYPVGLIGIIFTIPQILKIWIGQDTAGISVFTWSTWAVLNLFWIAYGIVHKEKPIVFTYIGWLITNLLVVIGTLKYG